MAKKVRTTQNKNKNKNKTTNKKKLGNTKRKLGTKRYKGGGNLGENELKDKYKKMLMDINVNIIGNIKLLLKKPGGIHMESNRLGKFMNDEIMLDIDQKNVDELKQKLKLVSDKLKNIELPPSPLKDKALLKAQQINAELA